MHFAAKDNRPLVKFGYLIRAKAFVPVRFCCEPDNPGSFTTKCIAKD